MVTVFLDAVDSETKDRLKSIFPGIEKTPKQDLVDPYVTVSFAGHSQHTSTVHEKKDPVWHTKLNLAVRVGALRPIELYTVDCKEYVFLQFPSMCNTIKIQLLDQ